MKPNPAHLQALPLGAKQTHPTENQAESADFAARAEAALQALHYAEAKDIVLHHASAFSPYAFHMYLSRIERGLYHYIEAESHARKALELSSYARKTDHAAKSAVSPSSEVSDPSLTADPASPARPCSSGPDFSDQHPLQAVLPENKQEADVLERQYEAALCELAKNLFAQGNQTKAITLLKKAARKQEASFSLLLALAFMYTEISQLEQAEALILRLEAGLPACLQQDMKLACDFATLAGDYYTFKEEAPKASLWYQRCQQWITTAFPDNWRSLRMALLLNNYGDLYEQQEEYAQARQMYRQAWKLAQSCQDADIYDLSAYQLEILFSLVNLYANMEDYDKAWQALQQLEQLLQKHPPFQKEVFVARNLYMKGLLELYMDTAESQISACRHLERAFAMQTALQKKGLIKLEHVGKSAYYLANALEDTPENRSRKQDLLLQALQIFAQVQDKELAFYKAGIYEMENDLGTLFLEDEPSIALAWYEKAQQDCLHYLQLYPADVLSKESWLYIAMNRLTATLSQPAQPAAKLSQSQADPEISRTAGHIQSQARKQARTLLEKMETWHTDLNLAGTISMLAGRLQQFPALETDDKARAAHLEAICAKEALLA